MNRDKAHLYMITSIITLLFTPWFVHPFPNSAVIISTSLVIILAYMWNKTVRELLPEEYHNKHLAAATLSIVATSIFSFNTVLWAVFMSATAIAVISTYSKLYSLQNKNMSTLITDMIVAFMLPPLFLGILVSPSPLVIFGVIPLLVYPTIAMIIYAHAKKPIKPSDIESFSAITKFLRDIKIQEIVFILTLYTASNIPLSSYHIFAVIMLFIALSFVLLVAYVKTIMDYRRVTRSLVKFINVQKQRQLGAKYLSATISAPIIIITALFTFLVSLDASETSPLATMLIFAIIGEGILFAFISFYAKAWLLESIDYTLNELGKTTKSNLKHYAILMTIIELAGFIPLYVFPTINAGMKYASVVILAIIIGSVIAIMNHVERYVAKALPQ